MAGINLTSETGAENALLQQFITLSSGKHNVGELRLNGQTLSIVNNHVWKTGQNNTELTRDENRHVRQALYNALSACGLDLEYLASIHEILLGANHAEHSLTREVARQILLSSTRIQQLQSANEGAGGVSADDRQGVISTLARNIKSLHDRAITFPGGADAMSAGLLTSSFKEAKRWTINERRAELEDALKASRLNERQQNRVRDILLPDNRVPAGLTDNERRLVPYRDWLKNFDTCMRNEQGQKLADGDALNLLMDMLQDASVEEIAEIQDRQELSEEDRILAKLSLKNETQLTPPHKFYSFAQAVLPQIGEGGNEKVDWQNLFCRLYTTCVRSTVEEGDENGVGDGNSTDDVSARKDPVDEKEILDDVPVDDFDFLDGTWARSGVRRESKCTLFVLQDYFTSFDGTNFENFERFEERTLPSEAAGVLAQITNRPVVVFDTLPGNPRLQVFRPVPPKDGEQPQPVGKPICLKVMEGKYVPLALDDGYEQNADLMAVLDGTFEKMHPQFENPPQDNVLDKMEEPAVAGKKEVDEPKNEPQEVKTTVSPEICKFELEMIASFGGNAGDVKTVPVNDCSEPGEKMRGALARMGLVVMPTSSKELTFANAVIPQLFGPSTIGGGNEFSGDVRAKFQAFMNEKTKELDVQPDGISGLHGLVKEQFDCNLGGDWSKKQHKGEFYRGEYVNFGIMGQEYLYRDDYEPPACIGAALAERFHRPVVIVDAGLYPQEVGVSMRMGVYRTDRTGLTYYTGEPICLLRDASGKYSRLAFTDEFKEGKAYQLMFRQGSTGMVSLVQGNGVVPLDEPNRAPLPADPAKLREDYLRKVEEYRQKLGQSKNEDTLQSRTFNLWLTNHFVDFVNVVEYAQEQEEFSDDESVDLDEGDPNAQPDEKTRVQRALGGPLEDLEDVFNRIVDPAKHDSNYRKFETDLNEIVDAVLKDFGATREDPLCKPLIDQLMEKKDAFVKGAFYDLLFNKDDRAIDTKYNDFLEGTAGVDGAMGVKAWLSDAIQNVRRAEAMAQIEKQIQSQCVERIQEGREKAFTKLLRDEGYGRLKDLVVTPEQWARIFSDSETSLDALVAAHRENVAKVVKGFLARSENNEALDNFVRTGTPLPDRMFAFQRDDHLFYNFQTDVETGVVDFCWKSRIEGKTEKAFLGRAQDLIASRRKKAAQTFDKLVDATFTAFAEGMRNDAAQHYWLTAANPEYTAKKTGVPERIVNEDFLESLKTGFVKSLRDRFMNRYGNTESEDVLTEIFTSMNAFAQFRSSIAVRLDELFVNLAQDKNSKGNILFFSRSKKVVSSSQRETLCKVMREKALKLFSNPDFCANRTLLVGTEGLDTKLHEMSQAIIDDPDIAPLWPSTDEDVRAKLLKTQLFG